MFVEPGMEPGPYMGGLGPHPLRGVGPSLWRMSMCVCDCDGLCVSFAGLPTRKLEKGMKRQSSSA